MARPPAWAAILRAARDEAVLAVRLYNDPSEPRSFEGFVVHMHVAWLYLLQARFARDGIDYRYRQKDNPRRLLKVDGEVKCWELARCVEERWPAADDAVRKNVEFFVGLRNKVEHRHAPQDRNIGMSVSGHAQAHVLNFEQELTSTFGAKHSLATTLRFPVFVGTFTTEGTEALLRLRQRLPADLRRYIAEFHSGLDESTAGDDRFELRLKVVLEQIQRPDEASLAIEFVRWNDLSEEERKVLASLGRQGKTIVREQKRSVVGHGLLRPSDAEKEIAAAIPFRFTSYDFLQAWKRKGIRPEPGASHPERTDEKYCVYDELSNQYGYTKAWVKWLVKKCSTADGFRDTTGREPRANGDGEI